MNKPQRDEERGHRWTVSRKKEVVLKLFRGEPIDEVSRSIGVEVSKLEEWREKALLGMDAGLKARENDPLADENMRLKAKLGEVLLDYELLRQKPSGNFIPGKWPR